MSTLPYLQTGGGEQYNPTFEQPVFVELWGGKGGHSDPTKRARSGYVSFWVNASPSNPKYFFITLAGLGIGATGQGFTSVYGNLGGQAGGSLAFCGGGASSISIAAVNGTNILRQVAIAAGSGGATKDGRVGGQGGNPAQAGQGSTDLVGSPAIHNSRNGDNAIFTSPNWAFTNTPGYLRGGNASRPSSNLTGGGGGGGAGYFSGGGGSSKSVNGVWSHGGGAGGVNYLDSSFAELEITPCENRTSTLEIGLTTTHPEYHSSGYTRGHDGCIRITAGLPPAPISFTTFSNNTVSNALLGEPIDLVGEATYQGVNYPIVWLWDGIAQPGTDFDPVRVSDNLLVGPHTATARVTNSTGQTQEIAKSVAIYDVSLTISTPISVITTAGSPITILGQLVVTNATLTSFTSKLGTNPSAPQSLGLGGSFSYSFNASVNTSVVFEANVNGRIFTTSVDIVVSSDTLPKISVQSPAEFSEWSHDQDIPFFVLFNNGLLFQGELYYDIGSGQVLVQHDPFQIGYAGFNVNPQQLGLSLASGRQQQIDFYLYDTGNPGNPPGYRPFTFYTYRGSIQFVGMSPSYSVDNVTQISVDTVLQANYDGQDYTTPFNLAKGFTKLYLNDSKEPFGFSGQGTLPIPPAGTHTITAILLKKDLLADPSFGDAVFATATYSFTVTPTQAPRTTGGEISLVRSIIESYNVVATSFDYTETTDLSSAQEWYVNGSSIGAGPSKLLDNLLLGRNTVEYIVTDPITTQSTSRYAEIVANAIPDPCFAGDNIVQLLDGRQVKMRQLEPGMMLMDYLNQPVAITGLKKMRNTSRQFIEIRVPGFERSLLLTKNHPILYQNAKVEAGLVAGQPGITACELEEHSDLYHIETEKQTFVQIQGAYVETVGRHDYLQF